MNKTIFMNLVKKDIKFIKWELMFFMFILMTFFIDLKDYDSNNASLFFSWVLMFTTFMKLMYLDHYQSSSNFLQTVPISRTWAFVSKLLIFFIIFIGGLKFVESLKILQMGLTFSFAEVFSIMLNSYFNTCLVFTFLLVPMLIFKNKSYYTVFTMFLVIMFMILGSMSFVSLSKVYQNFLPNHNMVIYAHTWFFTIVVLLGTFVTIYFALETKSRKSIVLGLPIVGLLSYFCFQLPLDSVFKNHHETEVQTSYQTLDGANLTNHFDTSTTITSPGERKATRFMGELNCELNHHPHAYLDQTGFDSRLITKDSVERKPSSLSSFGASKNIKHHWRNSYRGAQGTNSITSRVVLFSQLGSDKINQDFKKIEGTLFFDVKVPMLLDQGTLERGSNLKGNGFQIEFKDFGMNREGEIEIDLNLNGLNLGDNKYNLNNLYYQTILVFCDDEEVQLIRKGNSSSRMSLGLLLRENRSITFEIPEGHKWSPKEWLEKGLLKVYVGKKVGQTYYPFVYNNTKTN